MNDDRSTMYGSLEWACKTNDGRGHQFRLVDTAFLTVLTMLADQPQTRTKNYVKSVCSGDWPITLCNTESERDRAKK